MSTETLDGQHAAKAGKYVYFFGDGKADGNGKMKDELGGKGAGLAEMTNAGLPVPPGFTIQTEVCREYMRHGGVSKEADLQIEDALTRLEELRGQKLGKGENPLLVSVRSGARFSMPGMMGTILNLGLNDKSVESLAKRSNNPRFAYDSYRRLIQMFGNVVLDIEKPVFEEIFDAKKKQKKTKFDTGLDAKALQEVIAAYKNVVKKYAKRDFPQDPHEQLVMGRDAAFRSWTNERAQHYRRINNIDDIFGTAVNVQAMVFGNLGETSGTGVGFTRNPATGTKEFYGEFLLNAQGEDVVSGVRTPVPIVELEKIMPDVYNQLREMTTRLEKHYRDMQNFEFAIQDGKLYVLQTRNGKRTGLAAVRIAIDIMEEGLITKEEAIFRVDPNQLHNYRVPRLTKQLGTGEFGADWPRQKLLCYDVRCNVMNTLGCIELLQESKRNRRDSKYLKVMLRIMKETEEKVVELSHIIWEMVREGLITKEEDDYLVPRLTKQLGTGKFGADWPRQGLLCYDVRCYVMNTLGCIELLQESKRNRRDSKRLKQMFEYTESTAKQVEELFHIICEKEKALPQYDDPVLLKFMGWADSYRTMKVRANAEIPRDAIHARAFGAEGIGLCRTEHMFFAEDRIPHMRAMILATNEKDRRAALKKLLPMQRADFIDLFKAMEGLPVTIRLLDPPLHEFLPRREDLTVDIATLPHADMKHKRSLLAMYRDYGAIAVGDLKKLLPSLLARVEQLHEFNSMLGHRGCRLGITNPEITEMQARAIFEAAVAVAKDGVKVYPEVLIPMTAMLKEVANQSAIVRRVAKEVFTEKEKTVDYRVGMMIELPRAALVADEIAKEAEFFSFGTNDLTQTTWGFSRDDVNKILSTYLANGIIKQNPFAVLDREGVGELVRIGIERGRKTRPDLKVGICGELGGEPSSVEFCYQVGMDYVSCSPFRVLTARLAAAQAGARDKLNVESAGTE
jgi:pyruvate, orthophosphate dikinase